MNKLEREENLASAFSFFDKDGNGYITTDELSQACHEFGVDVAHLEDMIKDVEQNNVSRLYSAYSLPSYFSCILLTLGVLLFCQLNSYTYIIFSSGMANRLC